MGIFDVSATDLIEFVAEDLKQNKDISKPVFLEFVKTGANRQRAPLNKDWWFLRMASILYRVYKNGPVGTETLRTYYGGKKNRGVKPEHFMKASGKIIRTCLQELDKQGFIKKSKTGRIISGKGEKFLLQKSKDLPQFLELKEKRKAEIVAGRVKREKFVEVRRKAKEEMRRIGSAKEKKAADQKKQNEGPPEKGKK